MHTCPICKKQFKATHGRQVYCRACLDFPDSGKAAVYALSATGSTDIRYIGSTTYPVRRLMDHRRNAHGPELKAWIESIGGNFEMVILEIVPKAKARASEEAQIRHYERVGCDLINKRCAKARLFTTKEAHDYISRWFKNS
jgi:predicted GIY-YIG superfamily endonuclease